MRYYKKNIGDYAAATSHLAERCDLAYRRMIDLYYLAEKPLKTDPVSIGIQIRMTDDDAHAVIVSVLREFFTLEDDGWHQKRIDSEIEKFQEKAAKARANGKKGGRPKKKPKRIAKPSKKETEVVSEKITDRKLTTTHYPLPTTHVVPISPNGDIGREAPPAGIRDADAETIFHLGVPYLVSRGTTDHNARKMLGKLVSEYTKPAVAKAVKVMLAQQVIDPIPWLNKAVPAMVPKPSTTLEVLTGGLVGGAHA